MMFKLEESFTVAVGNSRVFTLAVFGLSLLLFSACQTVPVDIAAPKPPTSVATEESQLERGRSIYVSFFKCGLCHRPKPVYDYDVEQWSDDILPRMAKKARLKPEDYAAVLAYVTSEQAQTQP